MRLFPLRGLQFLAAVPPASHKELSLHVRENVCFAFAMTYIFASQLIRGMSSSRILFQSCSSKLCWKYICRWNYYRCIEKQQTNISKQPPSETVWDGFKPHMFWLESDSWVWCLLTMREVKVNQMLQNLRMLIYPMCRRQEREHRYRELKQILIAQEDHRLCCKYKNGLC